MRTPGATFFFQAEDGIRDGHVTGVQTCALPILPVLFDPNLRAHRWGSLDVAIELCRQLCEGTFCVRANADEARAITGEDDAARAAAALAALGAHIAVVTRGAGGAVIRGAAEADADGIEVE